MKSRDLFAASVGAAIAAAVFVLAPSISLTPAAFAQPQQRAQGQPAPDSARTLILAIASALASIAVDGERTAVALNEATDDMRALADRLSAAEKRLAALEAKR